MISSIQDPGDGRHARPLHHALPAVEGTSWARHARDGRWGWDAPAGVIVVSSMDHPWIIHIWIWLVVSNPLKNMSSSIGMIIPNLWENKTCSKPPTRNDGVIYEITTWRWIHMDTTVVMWSCYQANLWAHNDFIAKNSSKLPLQGASPASVQSACPDTIKINQAQSHHLSISVGVKKLWFISLLYFQQVAQQGSKPEPIL